MAEAERWKAYTQRQGQLLPAFVEEALERSDPVFFIDEAVEQLQRAPLEARYAVMNRATGVVFDCRGGFADRGMTPAQPLCRRTLALDPRRSLGSRS